MAVNERNHSLDVLKTLLAFLVVCHHTPSPFHLWTLHITTCAVPVFFMISGYLVWQHGVNAKRSVHGGLRMLCVLALSMLVYYFWNRHLYGCWWKPLPKDYCWFLLANVVPIGAHLWYLAAYAYILFILALLARFDKLKWLWWLAGIAAIIHLGVDIWHVSTHALKLLRYLNGYRNFFFTGLPFFAMGAWIAHKQIQIKWWWLILILAIGCVMGYWEIAVKDADHVADVYFTTPLISACLFLLFTGRQMKDANILSKVGQRYSLYIYLVHPVVIKMIRPYYHRATWDFWLLPICVFWVSLLVTVIIEKIAMVWRKRLHAGNEATEEREEALARKM